MKLLQAAEADPESQRSPEQQYMFKHVTFFLQDQEELEDHTGVPLPHLWYLGSVSIFQWHSNTESTQKQHHIYIRKELLFKNRVTEMKLRQISNQKYSTLGYEFFKRPSKYPAFITSLEPLS